MSSLIILRRYVMVERKKNPRRIQRPTNTRSLALHRDLFHIEVLYSPFLLPARASRTHSPVLHFPDMACPSDEAFPRQPDEGRFMQIPTAVLGRAEVGGSPCQPSPSNVKTNLPVLPRTNCFSNTYSCARFQSTVPATKGEYSPFTIMSTIPRGKCC